MSRQFTCSRGHQWQASEDDTLGQSAGTMCPVCASLFDTPPVPGKAALPVRPDLPTVPPRERPAGEAMAAAPVPGYELLGELGRGGMGVVYKARQVALDRVVALKMILGGGHAGEQERGRFQVEAEAVARLQHPHIVQVFEVGQAEAGPFLALELVSGGSLAQRLAAGPLPPREAAWLVGLLARAVQHAHGRGVVHRDLKPANVLLARPESAPEGRPAPLTECQPKVTDFGLAKRLDVQSGQTATGAVMGTPSYMAPEQALGQVHAAGPLADVYALGAILYECLTGRPPFVGPSSYATLEQVVAQEPVPLTRLQPSVPRDLETVCLKCLRKEPEKRYPSAEALADDLGRFLEGQPVQARPVGPTERLLKWARRRPAVAGLVLGLVLVSALGVTAVTAALLYALEGWGRADRQRLVAEEKEELAQQARRQEELARRKEELARKEADRRKAEADKAREATAHEQQETKKQLVRAEAFLHANRLALADREAETGNVSRAWEVLEACAPEQRGWEWHRLRRRTRCGLPLLTLKGHTAPVTSVTYSPDGSRLASTSADKKVRVWDAHTGKNLLTLEGHALKALGVAFSPDGGRLASASEDRTVRVWDAHTGAHLRALKGHTALVSSVAFSPDGARLASASFDQTVKVWDARTGADLLTLKGHTSDVDSVTYSPDGARLASASWDGTVKVWDARTGTDLLTLKGHTDAVTSVTYSPDGSRLASASLDRTVKVWDARTGTDLLTLKGHDNWVMGVAFSPDGARLASASWDNEVKVWDARTSADLLLFKGHTSRVTSVAFSPDGSRLFAEAAPGLVLAWDVRTGAPVSPAGAPALPPRQRLARHEGRQLLAWASGPFVFVRAPSDHPAAQARRADEDYWDTVAWRRQQAEAAEEAGDWPAALFHLDCLRRLQGDSTSPRPARDRLVAAALKRDGKAVAALLARARLALDAGDRRGYRAACSALPTGAGGPHAGAVAWACALASGAVPDLKPLLQAAEKGGALRAHGALLLRAGRHADALKRLDQALKARGPHVLPCEELLIAIACHHLGQPEDAKRWLARATAWLDAPTAARRAGLGLAAPAGHPFTALPGLLVGRPDERELRFGWQAWLDAQILRREAEALIGHAGR
jgi:WD40 repeat protein